MTQQQPAGQAAARVKTGRGPWMLRSRHKEALRQLAESAAADLAAQRVRYETGLRRLEEADEAELAAVQAQLAAAVARAEAAEKAAVVGSVTAARLRAQLRGYGAANGNAPPADDNTPPAIFDQVAAELDGPPALPAADQPAALPAAPIKVASKRLPASATKPPAPARRRTAKPGRAPATSTARKP